MKPSTKRLVDALLAVEPCLQREDLLRAAREGYFHDFDSNSATPILTLVHNLETAAQSFPPGSPRGAAFQAIANRAKQGDFDAGREEAEDWAAAQTDPEMRRLIERIKKG